MDAMTGSFAIGWRQVGACVALLAVVSMITSSYSVLAVPLGAEFQPSRMVLMLTMTVLSAVSALISPVLGHLFDRVSARLLMGIGISLLALGYTVVSFTQSFTQVLIVYGVLIAPASVLIGPLAATVLLSRWFIKHRGRAIGLAIAGISIGSFIFPPILQSLLNAFEWRMAFRMISLLVLLCTAPAVALVVNRPADRGLHPDGAETDAESLAESKTFGKFSIKAILTDPSFWMIGLIVATVTAGLKGMVTNLVPMALDVGISANSAALLISIYAAFGFVSKLGFAAISDRLNPRVQMVISLTGYAIGAALMVQAENGYWVLAAGVAFLGLFGGMMIPLESFLIPRVFGRAVVGRVGGMLNLLILSFLLCSPPLFGWIYDSTGNYDTIFTIFIGLAVLAMIMVRFVRLHPRALPPPIQPVVQPAE
jgi:MFS family permease